MLVTHEVLDGLVEVGVIVVLLLLRRLHWGGLATGARAAAVHRDRRLDLQHRHDNTESAA